MNTRAQQTNKSQPAQKNNSFFCCTQQNAEAKLNSNLLLLKKQAVNVVATEFDTRPTKCDIEVAPFSMGFEKKVNRNRYVRMRAPMPMVSLAFNVIYVSSAESQPIQINAE